MIFHPLEYKSILWKQVGQSCSNISSNRYTKCSWSTRSGATRMKDEDFYTNTKNKRSALVHIQDACI
jgi:hypothetical protein